MAHKRLGLETGRFLLGHSGSSVIIVRGIQTGKPFTARTLGLSGSTVHSGYSVCLLPKRPTGSLSLHRTVPSRVKLSTVIVVIDP